MPRVRRVVSKSASKDEDAVKSQEAALTLASQAVASGLVSPSDAVTGCVPPSAADEPDDLSDVEPWLHMNPFVYYIRQYGAVLLCITSVLGCGFGTGNGSEWWSSLAMVGWLMLMLVALGVHEFRPYHGPGWTEMYKARQIKARLDHAATQALVQSKEE